MFSGTSTRYSPLHSLVLLSVVRVFIWTVNDKSEALVVEPDKEVIELHAKYMKGIP